MSCGSRNILSKVDQVRKFMLTTSKASIQDSSLAHPSSPESCDLTGCADKREQLCSLTCVHKSPLPASRAVEQWARGGERPCVNVEGASVHALACARESVCAWVCVERTWWSNSSLESNFNKTKCNALRNELLLTHSLHFSKNCLWAPYWSTKHTVLHLKAFAARVRVMYSRLSQKSRPSQSERNSAI